MKKEESKQFIRWCIAAAVYEKKALCAPRRMTAIEDQKRFADLFRKLDAEIHNVPGGHVSFIVQAERYLDLMETFLQRNEI